jgi:hypothetical protein
LNQFQYLVFLGIYPFLQCYLIYWQIISRYSLKILYISVRLIVKSSFISYI